ncbi:hypothetical protein E4U42_005722, partial [Claviceps africana]
MSSARLNAVQSPPSPDSLSSDEYQQIDGREEVSGASKGRINVLDDWIRLDALLVVALGLSIRAGGQ